MEKSGFRVKPAESGACHDRIFKFTRECTQMSDRMKRTLRFYLSVFNLKLFPDILVRSATKSSKHPPIDHLTWTSTSRKSDMNVLSAVSAMKNFTNFQVYDNFFYFPRRKVPDPTNFEKTQEDSRRKVPRRVHLQNLRP